MPYLTASWHPLDQAKTLGYEFVIPNLTNQQIPKKQFLYLLHFFLAIKKPFKSNAYLFLQVQRSGNTKITKVTSSPVSMLLLVLLDTHLQTALPRYAQVYVCTWTLSHLGVLLILPLALPFAFLFLVQYRCFPCRGPHTHCPLQLLLGRL